MHTLGAMYATLGTTPAKSPPNPSSLTILDAHAATDPPYAFATSVIISVLILSRGFVIAAEKDPATAPHAAASRADSDTSPSHEDDDDDDPRRILLFLARRYTFFVTSNVVSWATRNGTSLRANGSPGARNRRTREGNKIHQNIAIRRWNITKSLVFFGKRAIIPGMT